MTGPSNNREALILSLVQDMERGQHMQSPLETPRFKLERDRHGYPVPVCWECGLPLYAWHRLSGREKDRILLRLLSPVAKEHGVTLAGTALEHARCSWCDMVVKVWPAVREQYLAKKAAEREAKNKERLPALRRARRRYYQAGRARARMRRKL